MNNTEARKLLQRLRKILDDSQESLHTRHPLTVIRNGLGAALEPQPSAVETHSMSTESQDYSSYLDFQSLPQDYLGLASAQNIDWNSFSGDFQLGFPDLWTTDLGNLE
jgi:hypothetical protein